MLIAEDLAVLLTKERGGWHPTGHDVADVLAGGLLAELVAEGFIDREVDPNDIWARRHVQPQTQEPPGDPVLAEAYQLVGQDRGAGAVQRRLAKAARDLVLPRLVTAEVLSAVPRALIGPRYDLVDESLRAELQAPLLATVVDGAPADQRTRTMMWLLHGAYCLRQALGVSARETFTVSRAVRDLGRPSWPEKPAIDAMVGRRAAVTAG